MPPRDMSSAEAMIAGDFDRAGCAGAMHVLDLATGAQIGIDADSPVVLASVFKVFIALEFYAQVESGALAPSERVVLSPGAVTDGPTGISLFSDPVQISLRDLALQMMSVSDNAATDVLLARVGRDQVNQRLRDCGCPDSVVECDLRTMFDEMAVELGFADYAQLAAARSGALGEAAMRESLDPGRVDATAAFDARRTNRSTPREMTGLLRSIWRDEAAPPKACANLRAALGRQVSTRLGRNLPDGAMLAAKTGSLTGRVRNEVGVITHADGRAFAVAVFTRAHAPFQRTAEIEAVIGAAAAEAIAALRA